MAAGQWPEAVVARTARDVPVLGDIGHDCYPWLGMLAREPYRGFLYEAPVCDEESDWLDSGLLLHLLAHRQHVIVECWLAFVVSVARIVNLWCRKRRT